MKQQILVTQEIFQDVLDYLREYFEVSDNQSNRIKDPERLAAKLTDKAGALTTLVDTVDSRLLSRCPKLKAVCNIAVGFNNIDLDACTQAGVMVTNTPGVLDDSTADFTWALILATARRVVEADKHVRAGGWKGWYLKQFLGVDVHHSTLGVLGFGRIGRKVAQRARGFDMKVLYHDSVRADLKTEQACTAEFVSMSELLCRADILTVHVPYCPGTHHLIGESELSKMKSSGILINASRGGVVDDLALAHSLRENSLMAAGLDVFENEPKLNEVFLGLKNVVLTPHIASSSEPTRHEMTALAAKNLVAALTTGRPPNLLNPKAIRD